MISYLAIMNRSLIKRFEQIKVWGSLQYTSYLIMLHSGVVFIAAER